MKYFTMNELCRSRDYPDIPNIPGENETKALVALVGNILDPLREAYGKPIRVNSGYRSEALNLKIKGAPSSQHRKGQAADITAGSVKENKILFQLIRQLKLPFDQLIDEYGFKWIHVSFSPRNRRQVLKAIRTKEGKTVYISA